MSAAVAVSPAPARQAAPIVRWLGGKTKLLEELVARMPRSFGRYFEPFAGGAALFFRVAPEHAVLADANVHLIAAYRAVAAAPTAVGMSLREHARAHSEAHYNELKREWNAWSRGASESWPDAWLLDSIERAASFIYLNKSGFNGLYRVNRRGEFNVAWGKRKAYTPDLEALSRASDALARATLRTGDFAAAIRDASAGDFVYFDPPYDAAFTGYTAGKFGDALQAAVAFEVRKLVERGVAVMVSNADTPRVRALYAGLRIDTVRAPRAINRDGKGRGLVNEVIVTAGYAPGTGA